MATKRKENKVALVTGATSGLGIALVNRLSIEGWEIRAVIRSKPEDNPEWRKLPLGVKPYVCDLALSDDATIKSMREACKGVNTIFHFASVPQTGRHKLDSYINTNVIGTENLLRAWIDANKEEQRFVHIIYASSTAVYGHHRKGEIVTEESMTKPDGAYGESKLMTEQVIEAFAEANKQLSYTIFRMSVIYGHGYEYSFNLVFKMLKEGRMKILGNGKNHLTLIGVDDIVDAILIALQKQQGVNNIFNITDGSTYTQSELIGIAAKMLKVPTPTSKISALVVKIMAKARGIDQAQIRFLLSDRIVSIDKARRELGFAPKHTIEGDGAIMVKEFERNYRGISE